MRVSVEAGRVSLTGRVWHRYQVKAAVHVAERVHGVLAVDEAIAVIP
jgi:osmotically-inducible protein OsmY